MLYVAICDDEPIHRVLAKDALETYQLEKGMAFTVKEFSTSVQLKNTPYDYDILLLDINLENNEDGILIAQQLRRRGNRSVIILVTSLSTRYPDGYLAQAIRYLEKPIRQKEFNLAMDDALTTLQSNNIAATFQLDSGYTTVKLCNLDYMKAELRKKRIYLHNEPTPYLDSNGSWEELLKQLPPMQFAFIQRGCLVNINNICNYNHDHIRFFSGVELKISQRKQAEFRNHYLSFKGGI